MVNIHPETGIGQGFPCRQPGRAGTDHGNGVLITCHVRGRFSALGDFLRQTPIFSANSGDSWGCGNMFQAVEAALTAVRST